MCPFEYSKLVLKLVLMLVKRLLRSHIFDLVYSEVNFVMQFLN